MTLVPVDLSGGQVSTADTMSSAASSVINFQTDVAGINRVRPGLVTYTTTGLGSAPLIGLYRFKSYVIGVDEDRKIYALPDSAPTVWTALSDATTATQLDGARRPVFAEDPSDLFIVGGGDIQKWTGTGLTARLGAGPQCSHIVNLGQRLIANDLTSPTRVYWSDLGDGSDGTWNALSFGTAEARPDPIVSIAENTAELILRGSSTIETWAISSDPLTPFERIVTINVGELAPYSAIRWGNDYAFLAQDDGRRCFVRSNGREFQNLSEAIEKDLSQLSTVDDCFGFREDTDMFGCLVWVFPAEGRTFVYDYRAKKWGERRYYSEPFNTTWPVSAHAYWPAQNLNLVGASTGAAVYQLDTSVRSDLSGTLLAERITGWQDHGTQNTKRSTRVRVTLRRGTAPLGGVDGQVEVAVDNDGKGFGPFKTITTGQPSDRRSYVDLYFGGVFQRRRYWIRYSGTDDVSIVSLHDDVTDLGAEA